MSKKWNLENTKQLFRLVSDNIKCGKSATSAFNEIAIVMETSPNSVRGYYYSQQRIFALMPDIAEKMGIEFCPVMKKEFNLFSSEQIEKLIETILTRRVREKSVRSIIADMANGDSKVALRYQNKYRSMIFTQTDRVKKITEKLRKNGAVFYDPYLKKVVGADNSPPDENEKIERFLTALTPLERETAVRILLNKN